MGTCRGSGLGAGLWVLFMFVLCGMTARATENAASQEKRKSHVSTYHTFIQHYADTRPMRLSYLAQDWPDREQWAAEGRAKMAELLAYKPEPVKAKAEVLETTQKKGYVRYLVRIPITSDRTTDAFLLVPDGLKGPAPAVVALHDHSGFYYDGKEKICETENPSAPLKQLIDSTYSGRTYADELARRGVRRAGARRFLFRVPAARHGAIARYFRQADEGP